MIVGIKGNLGTGKTATMARVALHYHSICSVCKGPIPAQRAWYIPMYDGNDRPSCRCKEPWPTRIHANFWIEGISDFHYVTCLADIEKIHKGYAFFDEMWSWIDSRGSGFSDINKVVTSILLNSRKRGFHIIYESKLIHMTDRRIREMTEYVLVPSLVWNNQGTQEVIEQDMLHPIDLSIYLQDMWIWVRICEFIGEYLYELPNSDFTFKLSEIMNMYSTTEEIRGLGTGEPTPGLEKGIKIETAFEAHLRRRDPSVQISRGADSRGWDVSTQTDCFDVVSVRKEPAKGINRIDIRGKDITGLLAEAEKTGLNPFWAFSLDGEWYSIPMLQEHTQKGSLSCRKGTKI